VTERQKLAGCAIRITQRRFGTACFLELSSRGYPNLESNVVLLDANMLPQRKGYARITTEDCTTEAQPTNQNEISQPTIGACGLSIRHRNGWRQSIDTGH